MTISCRLPFSVIGLDNQFPIYQMRNCPQPSSAGKWYYTFWLHFSLSWSSVGMKSPHASTIMRRSESAAPWSSTVNRPLPFPSAGQSVKQMHVSGVYWWPVWKHPPLQQTCKPDSIEWTLFVSAPLENLKSQDKHVRRRNNFDRWDDPKPPSSAFDFHSPSI